MNIDLTHVTRLSQLVAIALFVGVFALGYWLGTQHGSTPATPSGTVAVPEDQKIIADVTYACDASSTIRAIYRKQSVELLLSDGRHFALPQAVSGSGARYANTDEAIVFWNKGRGAFLTEGTTTTFANCMDTVPLQPE